MPTSSKLTPPAAAVCNKDATVFLLRGAGFFRATSKAGNSYTTGRVQEGRAVFPSLVFACLLVVHRLVCREIVTVVKRTDSQRRRERERGRRGRERERENTLLHKDKDLSTSRFFTNLSLMSYTATLNTSNKNTNNCCKLKYILRTKQNKIVLSK